MHLAALALVTLCTACPGQSGLLPKGWPLAKLTLPDDAKPAPGPEGSNAAQELMEGGQAVGKTWEAHFQSPSDWKTVATHVKQELFADGYVIKAEVPDKIAGFWSDRDRAMVKLEGGGKGFYTLRVMVFWKVPPQMYFDRPGRM